jgi:SAM-dependent methyltransferase
MHVQRYNSTTPRNPYDFYPTPLACAIAAIRLLPPPGDGATVLDPGAGLGRWGQAWREVYGYTEPITGVDLHQPARPVWYNSWYNTSFFNYHPPALYDYVIGNPPFSVAEPFVAHGLRLLKPGGVLLYLLRMEFLGSQERGRGIWTRTPPSEVQILVTRPSFWDNGKTDAMEYALFKWTEGNVSKPVLSWLDWW